MSPPPTSRLPNPALFICDIQDKFRSAIHEFPRVVSTAAKMLRAAQLLDIPVYVTTQNKAKLGETVGELMDVLPPKGAVVQADKTAFSMLVPEVRDAMERQCARFPRQKEEDEDVEMQVIIVGIETHVCVTQTTLDLLSMGHKVYILQDGVSSCNSGERGVALRRLQDEGAVVTTSESVLFELVGDAGAGVFKTFSALVKETKEGTKQAVAVLCGGEGEGEGGGSKL